jgi:hypothetical protein
MKNNIIFKYPYPTGCINKNLRSSLYAPKWVEKKVDSSPTLLPATEHHTACFKFMWLQEMTLHIEAALDTEILRDIELLGFGYTIDLVI